MRKNLDDTVIKCCLRRLRSRYNFSSTGPKPDSDLSPTTRPMPGLELFHPLDWAWTAGPSNVLATLSFVFYTSVSQPLIMLAITNLPEGMVGLSYLITIISGTVSQPRGNSWVGKNMHTQGMIMPVMMVENGHVSLTPKNRVVESCESFGRDLIVQLFYKLVAIGPMPPVV